LNEQVFEHEPHRRITFRITESNLPFRAADIRFKLKELDHGTQVSVSPIYALKYGVFGRFLDAVFVRSQYRQGMRGLLEGLSKHAKERQPVLEISA
jgi:hypothetical protein